MTSEALGAKATARPWRALADGNQYIDTRYLPTATLVPAARIEPIKQPYNPHAEQHFGVKPEQREVVRMVAADAEFAVYAVNHIEATEQRLREAERLLALLVGEQRTLDQDDAFIQAEKEARAFLRSASEEGTERSSAHRAWCDHCDGVGWYEGGEALQTQCERCNGTGWADGKTDGTP